MDERQLALIQRLSDGCAHSGEAIARDVGLTRAAVWKTLRKTADEFGLELLSERGRGYRLATPLELLDAGRIRATLSDAGRKRLSRLDIHPVIDSTNRELMRLAAEGAPSGGVCLAERQTAGRGRRGREWVSPFGVNVYLSLLWRYPFAPSNLGGASLAIGAVLAEVLSELDIEGVALKWPNDLLWQRRKLAGLLLEVAGESQGPCHLVVGLGLNLRMTAGQGSAIDQPWASLEEALYGVMIERNVLVACLLEALLEALDRYGREGLAPFLPLWRAHDAYLGEPVRLLIGERVIEGIHAGVAEDGSLLLDTPDGRCAFQAGEVSLRPLETEHS
ncbi:bifunctional biotin--[acetyl-CoA-carboxylase] ligase/biotin operon repressor BirA [Allochromatium palmeri]|uniref:Bifunctional ligase/repressor BirA n=1 Tax=Allochromatium palmeri TaxID=231048 RepID=A0A6N8EA97_9GAMM|nr:bifunctional biotin--[acetyl-CoA-carboxylase] ligase/biotin operon repressor BirA [Allochromatium palmeri]MTW19769.1 bifunctional biotin--[acetyl-CoA-carboxylase] ligase/biotin operon repressor BirA [Allochromatium palmeri]